MTESAIEPNSLPLPRSIGRVTEGLLLGGIAQHVDIIEPIAKFTAQLQGKPGVRNIFNMGLEDWQPGDGVQYDLIWIQWCAAYLTDKQLVQFLERCKSALNPDRGVIVFKENTSPVGEDMFDDVDSSVTRCVLWGRRSSCCKSLTGVTEATTRTDAVLPRPGSG